MERGATLPELITVLVLLGLGAPVAFGHLRTQLDALAVRAAREEAVALFHRSRVAARVHGDARILIVEGEGVFLLDPEGNHVARVVPGDRGVHLGIRGDRSRVEIRFGPLGFAAFAATTLELERGRRTAELVVSGHGRVRR